jgi:hypothetical protein
MSVELALFSLILLAAAALITAPLRSVRAGDAHRLEIEALEAARDAKLREIREAELDLRTGKLSRADHERVDRALRAEALALLENIDAARGRERRGGPP